ncbi:Coiled-coil domain-containing protein-like protein [Leptotrombidium deliense]|uniref:Coiled-coil domain-containing protein-like protein n=1 Tax=Leptotrombidium deliense TaxID=299467 RepID=A0A443SM55_9ACAR|nr:Coiled-coil domain-containing protein-like protein [Leptotrombidium deliense]
MRIPHTIHNLPHIYLQIASKLVYGEDLPLCQLNRVLTHLNKLTVPLPPPRSSSRITDSQEQTRQLILLSSLTAAAALANSRGIHPATVIRSNSEPSPAQMAQLRPQSTPPEVKSASNESVNSQDGNPFAVVPSNSTTSLSSVDSQGSVIESGKSGRSRQQVLEERHQELLKKQRLLQEQYTRLQQLSRGQIPKTLLNDLKKTGSESNILCKSSISSSTVSGSLRDLAANKQEQNCEKSDKDLVRNDDQNDVKPKFKDMNMKQSGNQIKHETQKIYETDIL